MSDVTVSEVRNMVITAQNDVRMILDDLQKKSGTTLRTVEVTITKAVSGNFIQVDIEVKL